MSLPLENRIALVTGASRGIGFSLALELARQGAHVIALARTQGGLESLDDQIRALGHEATLAPCDLKDVEALDRLGLAIFQRWGKLDIFVANAGVLGPVTPLAHIDPPQWADCLAVNVTANYRLIRSLDPLLRASDAGRVVALTSDAGSRVPMSAYTGMLAVSKAALDALMRTYAAETANTSNVRVMLADPGPVHTKLRTQFMPGEDQALLPSAAEVAAKIAQLCSPQWQETGKLFKLPGSTLHEYREPA